MRGRRERRRARARLRGERRDRERRAAAGRAAARRCPSRCSTRRRAWSRSPRSRATLGVPAGALLKAFPVIVGDGELRLVMLRGDHRVNEIKLRNALGADVPARRGRRSSRTGSGPPATSARSAPTCRSCSTQGVAARAATSPAPTVPTRTCAASSRAATSAFEPVDIRTRRGRRHGRRRADPDRAGDRGRQHLQARHALLRAARRHLPRRGRQEQPIWMGSYGLGPGAHRRRGGRAVRRRAGDQLAALDRPVRRRARRAGQGGHARSARSPSGCTASCARPASTCSTTTATSGPGAKFADAELLGVPAAADRRQAHAGERARSRRRCGAGATSASAAAARARRTRRRTCGGASRRAPSGSRSAGCRAWTAPARRRRRRCRPAAATRGRSRTRSATSGWR